MVEVAEEEQDREEEERAEGGGAAGVTAKEGENCKSENEKFKL